jgi:DNA-binding transcriptional LysR family regulator
VYVMPNKRPDNHRDKLETIAYSWRWLAAEDLAAGRLIEVLAGWTPSCGRLRLYYPSRKYVPAGLRAFIDLVREMAS